jgi:hypothetical protein
MIVGLLSSVHSGLELEEKRSGRDLRKIRNATSGLCLRTIRREKGRQWGVGGGGNQKAVEKSVTQRRGYHIYLWFSIAAGIRHLRCYWPPLIANIQG